ncbi:MAG: copper chaperone PCu(A)C [Pseudomonadota bacterium]
MLTQRLITLTCFFLLCGCGSDHAPSAPVTVSDAWVRTPMPNATMTAGYLAMTNTTQSTLRVVGVTSPQFARVEIHETTLVDGTMRMRPVAYLDITAGDTLVLKPGAQHLMLIEPKQALDATTTVSLSVMIEDGSQIDLTLPVSQRAPNVQ